MLGAVAWLGAVALAVFALVRLLGLDRDLLLVPLVAFTPWIALASIVPVAVAVLLRRWAALGVTALAAVALAALVLPRAFGGPTPAEGGDGPSLRVLAANVEFGQARARELLALADDLEADALVVSELTPRFAAALRRAGVGQILPHGVVAAEPGARGTGIYSRLPLATPRHARLPGGFALPSARLALPGAQPLELVGVHTVPPTSGSDKWAADLEAVPAPGATPTVLAGDFNATLDHADFRDVLDRGYADAAEALGEGLTPTWPAERRVPPLVAIDHVLVDERLGVREFSAHEVTGTDHRAVFAELELAPRAD